MRFSLVLRRTESARALPINYLYEVSSWIYHVLYRSDQDFAQWLHDQGYPYESKRFRLFGFSRLDLRPYDRRGDRLLMQGEQARLELGFALPDSAQHFLQGLFAQQSFRLGDRRSQVAFRVEGVQILPSPAWAEGATAFRASNPIVVSRPNERGHADYLSPDDPEYVPRLYQNLMHKMQSYTLALGGLAMPIPPHQPELFDLELLSEPKSQKITIAVDTPRQSEVVGYRYDFRLHCAPQWRDFVWQVGLGEKNAQGFGFVRVH